MSGLCVGLVLAGRVRQQLAAALAVARRGQGCRHFFVFHTARREYSPGGRDDDDDVSGEW
jgi:hypothetical protein